MENSRANKLQIKQMLVLAASVFLSVWLNDGASAVDHAIIVDQTCTDITRIPEANINQAKAVLHIAYGHTSHGSQLTDGMTGLVSFANNGGLGLSLPQNIFEWNNGGTGGALDLHDRAMAGDCGYYPQWVNETRNYLNHSSNSDVNVIIWSWCGQVSDKYAAGTLESEYLLPMSQLEIDYPNVTFVYLTGHVDHWKDVNNKAANQMIRDYCMNNNKVLYDFAGIESYDPDGKYYEFPNDNCDFYESATGAKLGNWAEEWQNAQTEGVDWYTCGSAHSKPLNANRKAYAAWWLWARLAGWTEHTTDLDVTHIERLPRYDYDAPKNNPLPGDTVTFQGHIKHWGISTLGSAKYAWYLGGTKVSEGSLTDLSPAEERVVTWEWTWESGNHTVRLVVDPDDSIDERSETNNEVEDRSNAIAVGFWVEQSVYDYFHQYQHELNVGSNSWEDWAQRQMRRWNELNEAAVWPTSPEGVLDRVRVDKIIVVPDGALPLAGGLPTNNPDLSDKTVDLMWGFPADNYQSFYGNHTSADENNPFFLEKSLIHELGHARYLIDCYGFDTHNTSSHHSVQIWEGDTYVAGSQYMPFLAFDSVLYYNHSGGVMTGPYGFAWSPYEARTLNLIAGHRATCGNYNAPCNIGIFLQDLPQNNHLRIVDQKQQPLAGANVRIYNAESGPGWYGKTIDNSYDQEYTTDSSGYIHLPRNPFNPGGDIVHTYGNGNGVMVLRIEYAANIWYRFQEVSDFNMEYWKGNTEDAFYTVEVDLIPVQKCPPPDMAEGNAADWEAWAEHSASGNTYVEDDIYNIVWDSNGDSSMKFVTDGGFDTYIRYPKTYKAEWDLSNSEYLYISFYAENPNIGFQGGSPWIRLIDADGGYFEYRFVIEDNPYDLLNEAIGNWLPETIDLNAPDSNEYGWIRRTIGNPDITNIRHLEIHADTWGDGFTLWIDEVFFDPAPPCGSMPDYDGDGDVDGLDLGRFSFEFSIGNVDESNLIDLTTAFGRDN